MCKKTKGLHNRIDKCMRVLIDYLDWYIYKDAKIVACCCGHGKYPMTILVKGKLINPYNIFRNSFNEDVVVDICSGIIILRTRNFYKKDKQGYYYIPEVLNQTNKRR